VEFDFQKRTVEVIKAEKVVVIMYLRLFFFKKKNLRIFRLYVFLYM